MVRGPGPREEEGAQIWGQVQDPVCGCPPEHTNRQDCKHYLPVTSLADGTNVSDHIVVFCVLISTGEKHTFQKFILDWNLILTIEINWRWHFHLKIRTWNWCQDRNFVFLLSVSVQTVGCS